MYDRLKGQTPSTDEHTLQGDIKTQYIFNFKNTSNPTKDYTIKCKCILTCFA